MSQPEIEMAYYALFYQAVDDFISRRAAFREEHLRLAREAHARGELLIFQGDSPAPAEAFARQDPYVKNGLVTSWKVRNWTVVVGNQEPRAPSIEKRAAESA